MKNIKSLVFLIPALCFLFFSCSKDPSANITKPILLFSKTTVKMGEPLYASLSGQATNTNVAWSSNSGGHIWPTQNTDTAIYIFTSPGTYAVKANFQSQVNGSNDSTDGNVIVTDSIFSDTVTVTCDAVV